MRYGRASTAYQAGWLVICTVRAWCFRVFDPADSRSLAKSNVFVCPPRIGWGIDSVTKTRRDRTGSIPSSPSDSLSDAPTAL